ncbi:MAG: SH3 domain-containing protein, partial [Sarcina sp.]
MNKRKVLSLLLASALITGGSSIVATANNKSNTNQKKNNEVLLTAPAKDSISHAVAMKGNSNFNLLSSPNENSSIKSHISNGEMLSIISNHDGFCKVNIEETGAIGYVNEANMTFINSSINKNLVKLNTNGSIINVSSVVNLRENASMNTTVLTTLPNNTSVKVLGKKGDWYKVSVNNQIGYIFSSYVNTNLTKNSITTENTTNHSTQATNSLNTQDNNNSSIANAVVNSNSTNSVVNSSNTNSVVNSSNTNSVVNSSNTNSVVNSSNTNSVVNSSNTNSVSTSNTNNKPIIVTPSNPGNITNPNIIKPETIKPVNPTKPDVVKPDTVKPVNPTKPDVVKPDTVKPVNPTKPDVVKPDTVKPVNPTKPDVVKPDTVKPVNPTKPDVVKPQSATLNLTFVDIQTGKIMPNTKVDVNGAIFTTNAKGEVNGIPFWAVPQTLKISSNGFESTNLSLDAKANETVNKTVRLAPITASELVTVINKETKQPLANTEVKIGDTVAKTNNAGQVKMESLWAGNQSFVVSIKGYANSTLTFKAVAGETGNTTLEVTPVKVAAKQGKINFTFKSVETGEIMA